MKMLPSLLRNLLEPRATRPYPAQSREPFPLARGELVNDVDRCIFCRTCAIKCPSQCIEVDRKAATWSLDPFACVSCGVCVEVCPVQCLSLKTTWRPVSRTRDHIVLKGVIREKKKSAEPIDPA